MGVGGVAKLSKFPEAQSRSRFPCMQYGAWPTGAKDGVFGDKVATVLLCRTLVSNLRNGGALIRAPVFDTT